MAHHVGPNPSPTGYQSEGARQVAIDNGADSVIEARGAEIGVSGSQWMQLRGAIRASGSDRDPRQSDVARLYESATEVLGRKPASRAASRGRVATASLAPSKAPAPRRQVHAYRAPTAQDIRENDRGLEQGKHAGRLEYARRMGGFVGKILAGYEHVSYRVRTRKDTRTGQASEYMSKAYKDSHSKHYRDGF